MDKVFETDTDDFQAEPVVYQDEQPGIRQAPLFQVALSSAASESCLLVHVVQLVGISNVQESTS